MNDPESEARKGVAFALTAHVLWALLVVYLKLLGNVPAIETAVHRGFWSFPVAALVIWWLGTADDVRAAMRDRRKFATLALSAILIASNWALYIWAIGQARVVETALGYYINPLMNVVLGMMFLGERMSRIKIVALVLAAIGVLAQALVVGVFPWVGLTLATTFSAYGFLKKKVQVSATSGFFIETLVLMVPAAIYILWKQLDGGGALFSSSHTTLLLIGLGPMTATPLLCYAAGVRRIWYSTAGIIQYLTPTLAVALAVFAYHEPMSAARLGSLAIIWLAILIFSAASLWEERRNRVSAGLS